MVIVLLIMLPVVIGSSVYGESQSRDNAATQAVHDWQRHAEDAAIARLHVLAKTCPGGMAEAWAKVNTTRKSGYEIIGQCLAP